MGPWVGQAPNPDGQGMFGITLTLTASPDGGRCGSVEYTNPVCGGTLEDCRLVGADIHTRELYTHGLADCAPAARVIIRCEGTTMRYEWNGQYVSTTTLRRPANWRPMPPPPPQPRVVPPPPPQQQQPQQPPQQPAPRVEAGDDDAGGMLGGCSASPACGSSAWVWLVAIAIAARRWRRPS
jgi:hypothetical protein